MGLEFNNYVHLPTYCTITIRLSCEMQIYLNYNVKIGCEFIYFNTVL